MMLVRIDAEHLAQHREQMVFVHLLSALQRLVSGFLREITKLRDRLGLEVLVGVRHRRNIQQRHLLRWLVVRYRLQTRCLRRRCPLPDDLVKRPVGTRGGSNPPSPFSFSSASSSTPRGPGTPTRTTNG